MTSIYTMKLISIQPILDLNGLIINSTTVASNITIGSGYNAMSVGPMAINTGIAVTVSGGQRWVIL